LYGAVSLILCGMFGVVATAYKTKRTKIKGN